jgi:hypothetical protein
MKKSPEYFRTYLRVLNETISYAETARILGDDPSLIFVWLKKSREDQKAAAENSIYYVEYPEGSGEPMWLHEHVRGAVSASIEQIEAGARSRAVHGTYSPAMYQGRTCYRINPDWEDEDLRTLLGLTDRDKYLRDEHGERVPEMVWQPPSTDLVLGILAAHSARYKRQSKIDIDLNARHSGGVLVAGFNANQPPKPLPQQRAAAIPMVEILSDEIADEAAPSSDEPDPEAIGPGGEDDLGVTDTPPDIPDDDIAPAQTAAPEPRVIREAPPAAYTPPPSAAPLTQAERSGRPLSPLERDLLSRARGSIEARSASPVLPPRTDRRTAP